MKISSFLATAVAAFAVTLCPAQTPASDKGYVIVTDYLTADGLTDVSAIIQRIIDDNPNRTIYFPDGVYLIAEPILTPADPKKERCARVVELRRHQGRTRVVTR